MSEDQLIFMKSGSDANKTIFYIHEATGDVFSYVAMSNYLDYDSWAIRYEPSNIMSPHEISLDKLAKSYAEEISQHSTNPIVLIGWSMGGLIAFEAARLLEEQSFDVRGVAVIDYVPVGIVCDKDRLNLAREKRELIDAYRCLLHADVVDQMEQCDDVEDIYELVVSNAGDEDLFRVINQRAEPDALRATPVYYRNCPRHVISSLNRCRSFLNASHQYRPGGKTNLKVTYIKSSTEAPSYHKDYELDQYCTRPIEYNMLFGDHFDLMQEPLVQKTAEIINNFINNL